MKDDIPGRELKGKEFRNIATKLVLDQGWRYTSGRLRGGHPRLWPPNPSQPPLSIPTSPSDKRALRNFIADVKRRGGSV
jgi:hypothetical protein